MSRQHLPENPYLVVSFEESNRPQGPHRPYCDCDDRSWFDHEHRRTGTSGRRNLRSRGLLAVCTGCYLCRPSRRYV